MSAGASVGSIYSQMILDTSQYEKALRSIVGITESSSDKNAKSYDKTGKAVDSTTDKVKHQAKEVNGLANSMRALGGVLGSAAIIGGFKSIVMESAKMETARTAFEVLIGSTEEAIVLLKELDEISLSTPFTPTQIQSASRSLLAFGFQASEVGENIKMLGDVASGTGRDLGEISLIFGQIATTGKLTGERLLQLRERGFDPLRTISDQTGESLEALQKRVTAGTLSFDELKGAFVAATSEGGQFNDAMVKQSQTLEGLLSTAEGNITMIQVLMGDVFAPMIKSIVDGFNSLATGIINFKKENEGMFDAIVMVTGAAAALVAVMIGGAGIYYAFTIIVPAIKAASVALVSGFGTALNFIAAHPVIFALTAITIAIVFLAKETIKFWSQIRPVVKPVMDMFEDFKRQITPVMKPIVEFANKARDAAMAILNIGGNAKDSSNAIAILATIAKVSLGAIVIAVQVLISGFKVLNESVQLVVNTLFRLLQAFTQMNSGNILGAVDTLRSGFDEAKKSVEAITNETTKLGSNVKATFDEMTIPVREYKEEIEKTKKAMKELGDTPLPKSGAGGSGGGGKDVTKPSIDSGMFEPIVQLFKDVPDMVKGALGGISSLIEGGMNFLSQMAEATNQRFANLQQQISTFSEYANEIVDRDLAHTLANLDLELTALQDQKDRMIQLEEDYIRRRDELRDEEAQKIRDRVEAEYQIEAERLQAEHEQDLEFQEMNMDSEEQRRLNQERLQEEHLQNLNDTKRRFDDMTNEEIRALTASMSEEDKARRESHKTETDAIADQEKAIEDRKVAEKEAADNKKMALEKKLMLFEWASGRAAFEMNKRMQMAQMQMQMAQGLMAAVVAGAVASITMTPFVGIPLGIALAGMVMSSGLASLAAVGASQYPPPPATAFATGGLVEGGVPGKDSVNAMLMPGELVVPRQNFEEVVGSVGSSREGRDINITGNNFYGIDSPMDFVETVKGIILEESRSAVGAFA